jgi:hypothetical protein
MVDGACECLNGLRRKMDVSAVLRPPLDFNLDFGLPFLSLF